MSNASGHENEMTVGLDVGDKYVHACFLDHDGTIVEESRVATTAPALRRRFGGEEHFRVVLEAGLHSPWMSRLLAELGHEVYVANPRRLRAIYLNENKSDRVDAEYLARIGRLDPALLFPRRHRSAETQTDLAILRSRAMVVKTRSALIQYVRGVVKSAGGRIPHCDARGFARKAELHLPELLAPVLSPVVATIAGMDATIRAYDKRIEDMAEERYPKSGIGLSRRSGFTLANICGDRVGRCDALGGLLHEYERAA